MASNVLGNGGTGDTYMTTSWELDTEMTEMRLGNLYLANGEVNIGHENTTMVVWIYNGV